jgi:hypothetical protein
MFPSMLRGSAGILLREDATEDAAPRPTGANEFQDKLKQEIEL